MKQYTIGYTVNDEFKVGIVEATDDIKALDEFWLRYSLIHGETADHVSIVYVAEIQYIPSRAMMPYEIGMVVPADKIDIYEACTR